MDNNLQSPEPIDDEISLLDLAIILAKHKKKILGVSVLVGIIAAVYSFTIPEIYTADVCILPPQQQQSGAAAMLAGKLGSLSAMSADLGIKNPNDTYIAMLKSRTIADKLIKRFHLLKVYKTNSEADAQEKLAGSTKVSSSKDGLIVVSVEDHDPKLAVAIANGYIEELQNLTQVLAVSEASQRRLFYEKQLLQAKEELSNAEIALKQTQEKTGLIQLDEQAISLVQATANIKAQIAMKEVQLGSLRTFATGNNPDYVRVQQELGTLRSQLAKVETGAVTAGKAPEAGLEYIRKVRNVKHYEIVYQMLAQQFEVAKLDEARDGSVIQVLDKAVLPEKRTRPKRTSMVLVTSLVGGLISVIWTFLYEALKKTREDPERSESLKNLRQLLIRWN
ncbi:Wzz/FepE/Etk N-terminal domain-containing protein [Chlorobium sp. KB01]|uniref:GumC family protein n=1 Tax=Chlorobium sp. KB01 TaxID=1917528 RepID=UPI00097748FC|nr:Wzz/FepE/Etk N-terminal domain-containing protein [Chlorobium sp. KB01]